MGRLEMHSQERYSRTSKIIRIKNIRLRWLEVRIYLYDGMVLEMPLSYSEKEEAIIMNTAKPIMFKIHPTDHYRRFKLTILSHFVDNALFL